MGARARAARQACLRNTSSHTWHLSAGISGCRMPPVMRSASLKGPKARTTTLRITARTCVSQWRGLINRTAWEPAPQGVVKMRAPRGRLASVDTRLDHPLRRACASQEVRSIAAAADRPRVPTISWRKHFVRHVLNASWRHSWWICAGRAEGVVEMRASRGRPASRPS